MTTKSEAKNIANEEQRLEAVLKAVYGGADWKLYRCELMAQGGCMWLSTDFLFTSVIMALEQEGYRLRFAALGQRKIMEFCFGRC